MEVSNAFGPETEPLAVPLLTSYFDGSTFVTSVTDDCTSYINTDATLANYRDGLSAQTVTSPLLNTPVIDGVAPLGSMLTISAPGAGDTGHVDLTYDAPSWLEFDWNGVGVEDPAGTASFGFFRGHDKVIYWREVLD